MGEHEIVHTLVLDKPLHDAGEEVKELRFREPTMEVLDIIERMSDSKKPQGASVAVLRYFTGVSMAALKRLSWKDTRRAMKVVDRLMPTDDDEDDDLGE